MALEIESMTPVTFNPVKPEDQTHKLATHQTADEPTFDDGTRQLLRSGLATLFVGLAAALLTKTVFGGIGRQGPHTNSGWLALIVALMCLPFGSLLTLLGGAKWLRTRRLRQTR